MATRRIVTGHQSGVPLIVSDGATPKRHEFVHLRGMVSELLWATPKMPTVSRCNKEAITHATTYLPREGETRFIMLVIPPDSVAMSPSFDPGASAAEYAEHVPDMAPKFETENPGMHRTESIDYGIVVEGEIWLDLDHDCEVHLHAKDVVVQNGTRHAWRNKSDRPTTLAFVLVGARCER